LFSSKEYVHGDLCECRETHPTYSALIRLFTCMDSLVSLEMMLEIKGLSTLSTRMCLFPCTWDLRARENCATAETFDPCGTLIMLFFFMLVLFGVQSDRKSTRLN